MRSIREVGPARSVRSRTEHVSPPRLCGLPGSSNTGGGAISSLGGTLSINGSTFSGNHADKTGTFGSPGGGAIFIQLGTAIITNSTFTANSTTNPVFTDSGGAIYNQGGTLSI